jgi:glycosyltransferase involved in cell wall biosynthesis
VGSSAWYKNRKGVLEAFINLRKNHDVKNPHLVFVGPELQSEEMTHSMTDKAKELSKHIIVLNKVSESALEMLYKNAKALIFPSFAEGFGWPPLEARALGCPVIASKTGAIHDILGDSATYVDPNNQKEINRAMLNAMNKELPAQSSNAIPTTEDCVGNYASLYARTMKHSHA